VIARRLRHRWVTGDDPDEPGDDHDAHAERESVCGQSECRPRLAHPAQVRRGEQNNEAERELDTVVVQRRERADDVVHTRRHRHGHRHDVVDEKGAGHDDPGLAADVLAGHLVVAAAGRIGDHQLPIRGHHREQQDDDSERQPRGEEQERGAREGQDEEDLLRRVGHAGQGVAGEDG
jgi:hypothetical protein